MPKPYITFENYVEEWGYPEYLFEMNKKCHKELRKWFNEHQMWYEFEYLGFGNDDVTRIVLQTKEDAVQFKLAWSK